MDRLRHIITCTTLGIVVLAFGLLCWFTPKDAYSESERRPLNSMPMLSTSSVTSGRFMDQFETYAQDAFPLRDAFRTIKALTSEKVFHKLDNNGLYLASVASTEATSIISMEYPLHEASVLRAADRFQAVYDRYLQGTNTKVYVSIVPDKNFYFAHVDGHLRMDYERLFHLVESGMPYASPIDITETLGTDSYYLTDPHWAQEALFDTAKTLLSGMGASADAPTYLVEQVSDSFYGSYYGQAALPVQPDMLSVVLSDSIEAATAFDYQNNREIPVYDYAKATSTSGDTPTDPYDIFLGGPLSLVSVENPLAQTNRELVIFRDSFASSIAPLLLEGYAKITLVDIRYMQPAILGEYLQFTNQDVLFLYSSSVLNNSETLK